MPHTVTIRTCLFVLSVALLNPSSLLAADPLATAVQSKQWDTATKLLTNGADPNQQQPDGMTPLHWAALHNREALCSMLVSKGAKVNAATEYGVAPLSIACQNGSLKITKLLLEADADPNQLRSGNESPLHTAARTGNPKVVAALLKAGAKVDHSEQSGQTALMWAAAAGNTACVDQLLEAGADPDKTSRFGFTAMFFAAREGNLSAAMRLLEAGVDVNAAIQPKNSKGRSPRAKMSALMFAVESGHLELAVELVKAGADPNDQRSGYAPLHAISWVRRTQVGDNIYGDPPPRISGKLTDFDFVRAMVRLGADVNLKLERGRGGRARMNHKGATPFLFASHTVDLPLMKLLVDLGADPSIPNADGTKPLLAAAGIGVNAVGEFPGTPVEVIDAIDYLLTLGNDINYVDENKETAMDGAAYRSYPEVVLHLAKQGADPEVWIQKSRWGTTPIDVAHGKRPGSFKPSPETVAALKQAIEIGKASRSN